LINKLILVDLWSDDKKLIEEALRQSANLFKSTNVEFKENRTIVHSAGGLWAILGAMRRWYINPDIQVQGCRALGNATDRRNLPLHAKEAGAFEVIVCAMKNYPDNCAVQMNSCIALGKLCFHSNNNAGYVVNTMKGHCVILAAMQTFETTLKCRSGHAMHCLC
jgi:hypothetical protein